MLIHESERHPCPQCDYKSRPSQYLRQHVKTVHKGVHYPCNLCDYKTTIKCWWPFFLSYRIFFTKSWNFFTKWRKKWTKWWKILPSHGKNGFSWKILEEISITWTPKFFHDIKIFPPLFFPSLGSLPLYRTIPKQTKTWPN